MVSAPYADSIIPLYLGSLTGTRYRSLNCLECGQEFLYRDNETMYRANDPNLPHEIAISAESVKAQCGNCLQWYGVQVSLAVSTEAGAVPLYMQPQSLYITTDEHKALRYVHCLECGKAFHSISDRISQVVDNRIPLEYLSPTRLGPIQVMCVSNKCSQEWAIMV